MELVTPTSTIRRFRSGDEPAIALHANDRDVARNLRDVFPHPYTLADAEAWVSYAGAADDHFAVVVDGAAVGSIGIIPGKDIDRRSAEIGYWLGRAYWGRGIATDAVIALSGHVFATRDIVRLFACVFEQNPGSARVLEKAGYTLEARQRRAVTKHGVTMDAFLYALTRPG